MISARAGPCLHAEAGSQLLCNLPMGLVPTLVAIFFATSRGRTAANSRERQVILSEFSNASRKVVPCLDCAFYEAILRYLNAKERDHG